MNSWIGQPIQPYLDVKDRGAEKLIETRGPDPSGHVFYVFEMGKNCRVTWEADARGIVVAWKSVGRGCKYIVGVGPLG